MYLLAIKVIGLNVKRKIANLFFFFNRIRFWIIPTTLTANKFTKLEFLGDKLLQIFLKYTKTSTPKP